MVVVGTSICGLLVLTLTQRRVEAAGPVVAGGPSALPPKVSLLRHLKHRDLPLSALDLRGWGALSVFISKDDFSLLSDSGRRPSCCSEASGPARRESVV